MLLPVAKRSIIVISESCSGDDHELWKRLGSSTNLRVAQYSRYVGTNFGTTKKQQRVIKDVSDAVKHFHLGKVVLCAAI